MMTPLRKTLTLACLLGLGMLSTASEAAAPARDPRGFLYGRITTHSGTVHEGRLRWGKEEAFWGDFFSAGKSDLPFLEHVPSERRQHRESLEVFGVPLGISWKEDNEGRQFVARFGDLQRIEVESGGDEATVVFKSGARSKVNRGSNDLGGGAEITVWDRGAGETRVRMREIRAVHFLPTPADLAVPVFRLRGTVHTEEETFRGDLQWDQDECLSTDELNGETREGEMSIPMGTIRSIKRRTRNSSEVVLRNGRTVVLDGSNDVDSSNRGIYVHDVRFGRVLISWDAFRRVDFDPPGGSGPAYTDFQPGRPLFGKVSTVQGKTWRGRLVYDADEADTMEFLDGRWNEIDYSIPFARIASLVPEKPGTSHVIYKDGKKLTLGDTADVGHENAGVLVFEEGQKTPRYIAWEDVRRIDFEER